MLVRRKPHPLSSLELCIGPSACWQWALPVSCSSWLSSVSYYLLEAFHKNMLHQSCCCTFQYGTGCGFEQAVQKAGGLWNLRPLRRCELLNVTVLVTATAGRLQQHLFDSGHLSPCFRWIVCLMLITVAPGCGSCEHIQWRGDCRAQDPGARGQGGPGCEAVQQGPRHREAGGGPAAAPQPPWPRTAGTAWCQGRRRPLERVPAGTQRTAGELSLLLSILTSAAVNVYALAS